MAFFNLIRSLPPAWVAGVVTQHAGELAAQLPAGMPQRNLDAAQTVFPGGRWSVANRFVALRWRTEERFLARVYRELPAEAWVVNTLVWPQVVNFAQRHGIPVVLLVTELEPLLTRLSPSQAAELTDAPQLVVAISSAVERMMQVLGRTRRLAVCPPALDTAAIVPRRSPAELRHRLAIPAGAFVWAMSGTIDPNKDAALFVSLAARVMKARPHSRFIWLKGGRFTNAYETYCRALTRASGLEERVIWTETLGDDYYDHFAACDAFVLPSRRESFSLVAAEALWLGKPVVAFDCGGIVDVVPPGGGIIVPPYDAEALVTAMLRVMDGGLEFDAEMAKAAVARFDRRTVASRWQELVAAAMTGAAEEF